MGRSNVVTEYSIAEQELEKFFAFVEERHAIYVRRTRGDPWPWTEDAVLQKWKFTNIYRELDTGTIWLRENIREPYADHPELFFNVILYRMYNHIPTAKVVGYIENDNQLSQVVDNVQRFKDAGNRIWTNAHMLSGMLGGGGSKIIQIFGTGMGYAWLRRKELEPTKDDTLESTFVKLDKIPTVGGFLAYEMVSDLRYTRYLQHAADIMTWANAGPGCQRGMQRLLGYPIKPRDKSLRYPSQRDYLYIMRFLLEESKNWLPKWMPAWEMREVEHSLCEYSKYMNVSLGQGKVRHKYRPPQV